MVLKVNTNLVQSIFLETMLQTMHMCMHIYFRYFNIFFSFKLPPAALF